MSALWVVPKATCTTTEAGSFVELGNFSSSNPNDVNQPGTGAESVAAGVNINCIAKTPTSNPVAVYLPYTLHQNWVRVCGFVGTNGLLVTQPCKSGHPGAPGVPIDPNLTEIPCVPTAPVGGVDDPSCVPGGSYNETDYHDRVVMPGDAIVVSISATTQARKASSSDLTQRWTESSTVAGIAAPLVIFGGQLGLNPVYIGPTTTMPLTELGNTDGRSPLYHKVFVLAATASGMSIDRIALATTPAIPLKLHDLTPPVVPPSPDTSPVVLAHTSELDPLGGFTVTWLRPS